ncbi:MAG TPA: methyltransferase domain-containing protein [Galbitalea sp.]|jgi:SAM-dependent methyltransferase
MARGEDFDAVRTTYDRVAASYAETISGLTAEAALDVAMIDTFAARVRSDGGGPVLDAGSGPGRVSAYLASLGLDVSGVDLSPGMVEVARAAYPHLRFEQGSLQKLDVADASLSGVIAWYSTIHTPLAGQPEIFSELYRVLRPGGHLLVGFHVGEGLTRIERAYGHDVAVDLHLFAVDALAELLAKAGFEIAATVDREPEGSERRPQGSVLARVPLT